MPRLALFLVAALALVACIPTSEEEASEGDLVTCLERPEVCRFNLNPLRLTPDPVRLPGRPLTFFETAETLTFVDADGQEWIAPRRTLTDGASIPLLFTALVGEPTAHEFLNAAAIHDAYCGVGNENGPMFQQAPWEDVHRMFYDGLIAGGTDPVRARLMFAAVWLGGPRWDTDRMMDHMPEDEMMGAMKRTMAFIEEEDPSLKALMDYMDDMEKSMMSRHPPR